MSALDYMQKVLDDVPRYTQADLDRAIAQARKDALEEAAKVAEQHCHGGNKDCSGTYSNSAKWLHQVSEAIRALQMKADDGTEGTT